MRLPRASGVLLHPTSLPGPHGSGDFGPAARHFVDWLVAAGQQLWQILPLGGIGPGNSPYMSTSAFAGNVLLIDLGELHAKGWLTADEVAPPDGAAAAGAIDYAAMVPFRMERLARAAARFAAQAGRADRADFDDFRAAHAAWLGDHALFMTLAEQHAWRDWCEWDPALARRDPAALAAARTRFADRIAFREFCQWRFFRQWGALKAYANERGVRIFGDAPIFVAHQSDAVWARPDLFELGADGRPQVIAGVPPDAFSTTGQRWGNPLYRWSVHQAEGFAWWIERLRRTFELVDIVRIDHFRGFAGCWEIPADEPTAIHGRWRPAPGEALFAAVDAALGPRPIVAEDLGVITDDVVALRRRFAFPGMRVLQFAFGGGSGNPYLPHNHEPDAVVYAGTHDNDTTRGWFARLGDAERAHVCDYLATDGRAIGWDLIRGAMASVADTAVHSLQDVLELGAEARMNLPGEGAGWWRWRFDWSQVQPWHAERLAHLTRLYRRDGTPVR